MDIKFKVGFFAIAGFLSGLGFLAAQELWWFATGMAGLCYG